MVREIRFVLAATLSLMSLCTGCFSGGEPPIILDFQANITGLSKQGSSQNRADAFSGFELVQVDGNDMRVPVPIGKELETRSVVRLHVDREVKNRDEEFDMLLGASFASGSRASGEFSGNNAYEGVFTLFSGWVFLWGELPSTRTEWASTAAEGTTIATQIVDSDTHRFFFVSSTGSDPVKVKWDGGTVYMYSENQYVDIADDGSVSGPHPIVAGSAQEAFLNKLKMVAQAAGWSE